MDHNSYGIAKILQQVQFSLHHHVHRRPLTGITA